MWGRKDNTEFGGNLLCFSIFIIFLFTEGKLDLSIIRGDTLTRVDSISGRQSLISKDGIFELGFFTTGSSQNVYLGIWYKGFAEKTVVWVANRETPLPNKISSELKISPSGNLELFDVFDVFWSTNLTSALPDSVEAVLLDDGNLILRDGSKPTIVFWQSFDYPTDTWLPGAALGLYKKTGKKQRLVSWKSADDPSPGMFSLEISEDQNPGFFLEWNLSTKYWMSGSWNGVIFGSVPEISYFLEFKLVSNENETYYTYSLLNNAVFSRFMITESGNFEQITSLKSHRKWSTIFFQPKDPRDVFAFCGQFGIFNENLSNPCTCLQGFSRISTGPNHWSHGCSRRTLLPCEGSNPKKGKKDTFLKISTMNLPANPVVHPAQSEKGCKLACQGTCSCTAYAFSESKCSIWDGALLNLQQPSDNLSNSLHVKVANSDAKGKQKILEVIVAVLVPLVVLVSGGFLACFYTWRIKKKGNKDSGDDLLSFDFDHSCNLAEVGTIQGKRNKKDFDLPMFSYTSVSAATDNFSPDNKLGEGGFGPVYKGKLLNGQQIALKRLSKKSGQGFEEFRNEIILIAKLQHRNLVRLLGCCIEQDESILIYEYMPNKSLDFFLFDSNKRGMLDWATRVSIIEGIAQGLLYLHEHSRLRIIHRDLKASNILLGSEMNPKISDFGMARIFGGNDSQTNTKRIVGT